VAIPVCWSTSISETSANELLLHIEVQEFTTLSNIEVDVSRFGIWRWRKHTCRRSWMVSQKRQIVMPSQHESILRR
jgi:hypothetical protein